MKHDKQDKSKVYLAYDIIADWFEQHRCYELFEKPILDRVIELISPKSSILDLGCGTGKPILEYFVDKGYSIVGVDASEKLLDKAKTNFPAHEFLHQDIRKINLDRRFDCIITWHCLFHLPKDDQRSMFEIFQKHIKPKGILIFTSGSEEGESWADNGGKSLYHSSLSINQYRDLLQTHGFEILFHEAEAPSLKGATVWIAQARE